LIVTVEVVTQLRTNQYRTCLICACVCKLDPSRLTSAFLTRAPPPASIRYFQVLKAPEPPTAQHHAHSLQTPQPSHKTHPQRTPIPRTENVSTLQRSPFRLQHPHPRPRSLLARSPEARKPPLPTDVRWAGGQRGDDGVRDDIGGGRCECCRGGCKGMYEMGVYEHEA